MQRPVWLLSMDSDLFPAAPMTTGGLKAFFQRYGETAAHTHIELVHFVNRPETIAQWCQQWLEVELPKATAALAAGLQPVVGFSVYTWNAAEFLDLMRFVKNSCPQITLIAGGPHVQQARDYLFSDPIDLIILGEGEISLQQWLDHGAQRDWSTIAGLAFVRDGELITTTSRERTIDLDSLPSALEVIELVDDAGKPLYDCIAYETSRGCPYRCAFCEWGTGAIGTKMKQFSLTRIRSDWEKIIAAGIRNIWLTDSNFGALREDLDKAKLLCEFKRDTGLPATFATSWSKKHNQRVQDIVLLMHEHDLLPHYHLALQTLTPLALELSNRKNMSANQYEPIAKQMAKEGVPIACELIWGLPGDNLASFERNLDRLFAVFPTINIFGYTLLPGTEFYEKRAIYQIQTLPVAGYGKAKGEYVIGCHTFAVAEGMEGYYLITAHLLFNRGYMTPLTLRYLALQGNVPVSALMREMLSRLLAEFDTDLGDLSVRDFMAVYEHRAQIFLTVLTQLDRCFTSLRITLTDWLQRCNASSLITIEALQILQIDQALCPRTGPTREEQRSFSFAAEEVRHALQVLELPSASLFADNPQTLRIWYPGGVGDIVRDPDGGTWIHGKVLSSNTDETGLLLAVAG